MLAGLAILALWVAWGIAGITALVLDKAGRTPSSDFVVDAFGQRSIVFDQVFPSTGSSGNDYRIVLVATGQTPREVLNAVADLGDWKPSGPLLINRESDLCVGAYTSSEFLAQRRSVVEAADAARSHPDGVVLSLSFC